MEIRKFAKQALLLHYLRCYVGLRSSVLGLLSLFFVLSLFLPALNSEENAPIPLDHWSYDIIEYFSAERILSIDLQTKPITRKAICLALDEVKGKYVNNELALDNVEENLLASLYEEFSLVPMHNLRNVPKTIYSTDFLSLMEETKTGIEIIRKKNNWEYEVAFQTSFWSNLSKHISFAEEMTLIKDNDSETTIIPGTRKWKGIAGTTPSALFSLSFPHIEINAGRTTNWLGPGRFGTLLLSNNYPFFDEINTALEIGKFKLSSFFIVVNIDSMKFLAGHRAELKEIYGITFGFNEFVLFSGRIEPGYLNPLLILYGEQYNRGDRDNIMWSFDLSFHFLGKSKLYSEFLIDDFQYESTPPAPNKIGSLIGLQIAEPLNLPRLQGFFEYTRIAKWVYTHKYSENTYSNFSACLGHPLGPDGDELNITFKEYLRWNVIPQVHFGYIRKGEGNLQNPWQKDTDPHPPFPSGIVESTLLFEATIFLKPFRSCEYILGWKTYRTENLHNIQDWTEQDNEFYINISLTF